MDTLFQIIIATLIVSLLSFVGVIFYFFKAKKIQKYNILLVAFAAGVLLGAAFLHLIPESFEHFNSLNQEIHTSHNHNHEEHSHSSNILTPGLFILLGILLFYIIEKIIHWHHHHDVYCKHHSIGILSLVADGFHNFIDGGLIAITYMTNPALGLMTTISIIAHEIPQELGDYAILIHSGYSKVKALIFNFLSGLTAVLGALITYFFISQFQNSLYMLLALTAGSFIYLALADIIPDLNTKKYDINKYILTLVFLLGIISIFVFSQMMLHNH